VLFGYEIIELFSIPFVADSLVSSSSIFKLRYYWYFRKDIKK